MLSRYVVSQVKHNSYFLVGLAAGLWLALVAVPLEEGPACEGGARAAGSAAGLAASPDELEPVREARPLGPAGAPPGRSLQRPRYYTTELGIKGSVLAGVLSSEATLGSLGAALNATAAPQLPALRFFLGARAAQSPARPNVVGFTDTRAMLLPFHALKYLADNYLDEFAYFLLVTDGAYVNARRVRQLTARLSAGQHVYMGEPADAHSDYCSLEAGILLSSSVLRAVHAELDWCVRNSYSPHHHENVGRCVLHAAQLRCTPRLQALSYAALRLPTDLAALPDALAALPDAPTAYPVSEPALMYALHTYVSRVYLQRARARVRQLRAFVWRNSARHPRHYRNGTWPGGLRADAGLLPPVPPSRFHLPRWTPFNRTHAQLHVDTHAATPLTGSYKEAVDLVLEEVTAWCRTRWGGDVQLVEGAWRWEAPHALRYRLLLRQATAAHPLRLVEAARVLGAARLVPVPYVTESARVHVLAAARHPRDTADARALAARWAAGCGARGCNARLLLFVWPDADAAAAAALTDDVAALSRQYKSVSIEVAEVVEAGEEGAGGWEGAMVRAAAARLPRDALVLLLGTPRAHLQEEFLNRVRMNTIPGEQWYLPAGYARPAFGATSTTSATSAPSGGRFDARAHLAVAFYRRDLDAAMSAAGASGAPWKSVAALLAASPLRCVHAPEPALQLAPPPRPCGPPQQQRACLSELRAHHFTPLQLSGRAALARLLLEARANEDRTPTHVQ